MKAVSTKPTVLEDIVSEDITSPLAGASIAASFVFAFAAANEAGKSFWTAGLSISSTSTSGAYET